MAVVDMTRVRIGRYNDIGAWFIDTAVLSGAGESDTYVIPVRPILDLGCILSGTGTGTIEFTFGTPDEILAGTAVFIAWDGTSKINCAATAWKVVSVSGVVTGKVTIKTTVP